jgi:hypothetical protein
MTGLGGKGKDPERCNIVEAEADWILQPAFKLPGVFKAADSSSDHLLSSHIELLYMHACTMSVKQSRFMYQNTVRCPISESGTKRKVASTSSNISSIVQFHLYLYILLYTMPTASSSKPSRKETAKKPYDRSFTSVKASQDLGAPATLGQKTRKGKKAWRKNIDVRDEEEALEAAREEERVTG